MLLKSLTSMRWIYCIRALSPACRSPSVIRCKIRVSSTGPSSQTQPTTQGSTLSRQEWPLRTPITPRILRLPYARWKNQVYKQRAEIWNMRLLKQPACITTTSRPNIWIQCQVSSRQRTLNSRQESLVHCQKTTRTTRRESQQPAKTNHSQRNHPVTSMVTLAQLNLKITNTWSARRISRKMIMSWPTKSNQLGLRKKDSLTRQLLSWIME